MVPDTGYVRTCNTCEIEKPLSEFYAHARYKGGRKPRCKRCEIASQAEYQKRPDVQQRKREWARGQRPRSPEQTRRQRLWTWHRLTMDQYQELLDAQDGKCAICRQSETATGRGGTVRALAVDHDHACCPTPRSCGKCVRGLLCNRCNPLLGYAKDDVGILRAALAYLED